MILSLENLLAAWLSSFSELPTVSLELLPKKNGAIALKMKKGPQIIRRYISGKKLIYAEFTLRMRVSNADTKTRLEALNTLETAGKTIKNGVDSLSGVNALKAELKDYPKLCQRTDNGDDEYEAAYYIVFSEDDV